MNTKYVPLGILGLLAVIAVLLAGIYFRQAPTEVAPASVIEARHLEAIASEDAEQVEEIEAPAVASERPIEKPGPARPVRTAAVSSPVQRTAPPAAPPAVRSPSPAPAIEPLPDSEPYESAPAPPARPARSSSVLAKANQPAPPPPPPPAPRTVTLPAGTRLEVRLASTVSTERNRSGDRFTAYLDRPLIQDGLIIAEKGAEVEGRVVEARRAGRVSGLSYLSLELAGIKTDDGQRVTLATNSINQEGESTKGEDVKKIGIGAAIGAGIGAIAGGGKGAAIGAGVGGGAGAGTAAATRGEAVVLAPETRLSFALTSPVTITERL